MYGSVVAGVGGVGCVADAGIMPIEGQYGGDEGEYSDQGAQKENDEIADAASVGQKGKSDDNGADEVEYNGGDVGRSSHMSVADPVDAGPKLADLECEESTDRKPDQKA